MEMIHRKISAASLFDVHQDNASLCGAKPKPRAAVPKEIYAYAAYLAGQVGLQVIDEHREIIGGAYYGGYPTEPCKGVTYGEQHGRDDYEPGSFSVPFPGRNAHRDKVTMDTLDDAGEVVASSTLPVEPKKLGVVWNAKAVRAAVGPNAKPAKTRKGKAAPAVANVIDPPAVEMAPAESAPESIASAPVALPDVEALETAPRPAQGDDAADLTPAVAADCAPDWTSLVDHAAAPPVAPVPDLAATVSALVDKVASMQAVVDDLMAIALRESPATPVHGIEPPARGEDDAPAMPAWEGARDLAAMRNRNSDIALHDRAKRLRLVRRYLAMRRQRDLDSRALAASRDYLAKVEKRADDAAFALSDAHAQLATQTARADAAEALAIPAIDKAQARIVELERMVGQWSERATAAGYRPVNEMARMFRPVARPMMRPAVASNVIIMKSSGVRR